MRKNERFRMAMERTGLAREIEADFKGWGRWDIDNADVCLWLQTVEGVDPSLLAVTWLNETTGRFISEPNKNNSDDFNHWDVGPGQTNVGNIHRNIANQFLNVKGLDVQRALGTESDLFDGDPVENLQLASRFLLRIGRGTITGPSETVLYESAAGNWSTLTEAQRNERRAVAYTGPNARPARYRSWVKYAPLFELFFSLYNE